MDLGNIGRAIWQQTLNLIPLRAPALNEDKDAISWKTVGARVAAVAVAAIALYGAVIAGTTYATAFGIGAVSKKVVGGVIATLAVIVLGLDVKKSFSALPKVNTPPAPPAPASSSSLDDKKEDVSGTPETTSNPKASDTPEATSTQDSEASSSSSLDDVPPTPEHPG